MIISVCFTKDILNFYKVTKKHKIIFNHIFLHNFSHDYITSSPYKVQQSQKEEFS